MGKWAYDVNVAGGYLYVRYGAATPGLLHVWDVAAGQWIDKVEPAHGLDVSPPDEEGRVYFVKAGELAPASLSRRCGKWLWAPRLAAAGIRHPYVLATQPAHTGPLGVLTQRRAGNRRRRGCGCWLRPEARDLRARRSMAKFHRIAGENV